MTYELAFSALADPTRRRVFEVLAGKPRAVGEIAAELPVSRPAVSQHLKVLSDAGLVMSQAEGARRIYAVRPEGLAELRAWLDQYWSDVMNSFAEEVNEGGGPMTEPIVKTVIVNASGRRAFDIFVNRIAKWWPLDGHAVSASKGKPALAVVIEPRVGGAIYETMFDGTRADWGKVLEFDVGHRLAFTWHPGTNADKPTRVDVAFEDNGAGQATVTLTHSGWEFWASDAPDKRSGYDSGWDFVLGQCFANAVTA